MGKVNFLSGDVVKRIAAGEVVDRPASVVKELMENSLDAGALSILVEIKDAGKSSIVVKDDGDGIESDDMPKLFQRHATSKVSRGEDLYRIQSLGFRGEALYSIGSVADVVLKSATSASEPRGRQLHIRGGERLDLKDISHPRGTTMEVREIFFNTPARKKFLKTDSVEWRHIMNIFTPYSIAHHDRRFSLFHNGKRIAGLNPSASAAERFCDVLNLKRANILEGEKNFPEKGFVMRYLLGDMNITRPRKNNQYIFINGRPVNNYRLSYAVNQV